MNTTQATGSPCGEMLLREWLTYWLENYIRPVAKPSGYEHYRDNVEKHILPRLGDTPMSALSPRVLQQFFNEEARSGNLRNGGSLSPKSMRNMRVVLDVALKQALAEGVIGSNPVPLTAVRAVRTPRVQILTDEAQAKLEEYLFSHRHNYHAGILLAMFTGMRLGEVCALQWKDYDPGTGRLRIGHTVRRQPITMLPRANAAPCWSPMKPSPIPPTAPLPCRPSCRNCWRTSAPDTPAASVSPPARTTSSFAGRAPCWTPIT